MTFWAWLDENKTKIIGTLATIVAALLSMIALGMFDKTADDPTALMSPHALRWLTVWLSLANVLLGGSTVAAGVSNTKQMRVAQAQADLAQAQAVTATQVAAAINTPPPPTPVPVILSVETPPRPPGG